MSKKITAAASVPATPAAVATPASFEEAMEELALLVARMEAGELALEASVAAYARGSELVRYCAFQLEKVEKQVSLLDEGILSPLQPNHGEARI